MARYGVQSAFLVTSAFAINSLPWTPGDFLPRNVQGTGIAITTNSAFLLTFQAQFGGMPVIDCTSFIAGAATIGAAGFWFVKGWMPDSLWVNVTSCRGNTNVGVSFSG
jgi:hypothetical protein